MDWKQKAFDALAEKKKKEAKKQATEEGKDRVESAEKLTAVLQEFFSPSVAFTIDHDSDNNAMAFVEGLDGVEFSWGWYNIGSELIAEYNGVKSRLFEMDCLGKLLQTPTPVTEDESAEKDTPSVPEKRLDMVSIKQANVLHSKGREFAIHSAYIDESGEIMIIEFTDLWKIDTDDDLPF